MKKQIYTSFDGLALPGYNWQESLSPGSAISGLISILGGYADRGGERTHNTPAQITITGTIKEENAASTWTVFQQWCAKQGKRGKLKRTIPDGTEQWTMARLLTVISDNSYEGFSSVAVVTMTFEQIYCSWIGKTYINWCLNDGYKLNNGNLLNNSKTFTLTAGIRTIALENAGLVEEKDLVLTITAGSSAIPSGLSITGGGSSLTFNQSIASGKSLVIDCGARSVKNNSVDAYAALVINAAHSVDGWIVLQPGTTILTFSGTAAMTIQTNYSDRYP